MEEEGTVREENAKAY